MKEYKNCYTSPYGQLRMTSDGEYLTRLEFSDDPCTETNEPGIFGETVRWLDCYFSGGIPDFTPSIRLIGTPFRQEVWDILKTIPYGKTMTYGEIAKLIADRRGMAKMSAQAVGNAVGSNPVSIIVPCHRVIGEGGKLTGYEFGLDKKSALLCLEGHTVTAGRVVKSD